MENRKTSGEPSFYKNHERFNDGAYYLVSNDYLLEPLKIKEFSLYQLGRRFCKESAIIPRHAHLNWFELTVVTGGKGTIYSNGENLPVKEGDIYLSFPADQHGIVSDSALPLKYDFLAFYLDSGQLLEEFESLMVDFHNPKSRLFSDGKIAYCLGSAIEELGGNEFLSKAVLLSILRQIAVYTLRDFRQDNKKDRLPKNRSEILCYKIMNYIDSHLYSLKTLANLESLLNYNLSYISTLFKKTTGGTLNDYFRRKKLSTAKLLLKENRLKISEISALLGYSSVYSFSKAFKTEYGVPPKSVKRPN